jgi:hypothetical protein
VQHGNGGRPGLFRDGARTVWGFAVLTSGEAIAGVRRGSASPGGRLMPEYALAASSKRNSSCCGYRGRIATTQRTQDQ